MMRDKGAGAFDARRRQVVELFDFRKTDVDLRLAQARALAQQLGQAVQRLRAEHHVHIGRAGDDGLALLAGDAAADADQHAFFLQVLDAAQVAEHLFLRLFAHRAGVEQDQVGLVDVAGGLVTFGRVQHVGHLVRVVLVHLAAEGFDKDFFAHGFAIKLLAACARWIWAGARFGLQEAGGLLLVARQLVVGRLAVVLRRGAGLEAEAEARRQAGAFFLGLFGA